MSLNKSQFNWYVCDKNGASQALREVYRKDAQAK